MHHDIIVVAADVVVVVPLLLLVESGAVLKVLREVLVGRLGQPRHEQCDHDGGSA